MGKSLGEDRVGAGEAEGIGSESAGASASGDKVSMSLKGITTITLLKSGISLLFPKIKIEIGRAHV